jgi:hypothetical protein
MAQQKQRPVHEIRLRRIKASIWANETEEGDVWFNVAIARLYKEGDQWRDTSTFSRDDLPLVAKAADMAFLWIWGQDAPADSDEAAS